MTRRFFALLLACGLTMALVTGCTSRERPGQAESESGSGEVAVALPASNLRMAQRLQALADAADPREYYYDNDTRAERALKLALSADPGPRRFQLLTEATLELVRAGQPDEALTRLDEAEELLRHSTAQVGVETQVALLEMKVAAGLRLGEQENCLLHPSDGACILPLQPSAQHERQRGSTLALGALEQLLEMRPDSLKYRWLLNLAAMTLGRYPDGVSIQYLLPPEALGVADSGATGVAASAPRLTHRFRNRAAELGVGTVSRAGGAVIEDFDGDGRLDLVASSWGLHDPLHYYRQLPDGTFEDRTDSAFLTGQHAGINLVQADYDNDGDADLLVLRGGWLFDSGDLPDSLLRNEGGRFVDVTEEAGLFVEQPTHTAAWADFDLDGHLDLFVGAEPSQGVRHPSRLYRNLADGTFDDVAADQGLRITGLVKGAAWGDFDDDGLPDLYVSRFAEPNLLYRNLGPGSGFEDVTDRASVAEPRESFPTWFFDYDQDGRLDLFVAGFSGFFGDSLSDFVAPYFGQETSATTNRLYRNLGDGTFEDVTAAAALDRMMLAMGANYGDLDGDGFLDIYLGTGEPAMTTLVPNVALRNSPDDAGGRRFDDFTAETGLGSLQKGHGVAFGDIDGDGDEDIYVTMGGAYSGDVFPNLLFENPGNGGNGSMTLVLRGRSSNRDGIGARVTIETLGRDGGRRSLHRTVGTGGSFGSSSLQLEVGLGEARRIDSVDVRWPGPGHRTRYLGIELGAVLSIPEPPRQR